MSGESHFRGHLFADLRGSTAFTERAGNAAGADLVRRFRQLVRDEVGRHEGAEVKTEGDAIYVVFPSASTAVMCGLAIIDKAEEMAAAEPEMPMHVGVGVHAGEAVAVPEGGYIGTAVNLASRVCAVAGAGELLVTGTVRGILQASIPVKFVSRGKRRLKGITEPVELFLVVPQGRTVPSSRRPTRRVVGVAAAGLLILLVAAVGFSINIGSQRAPTITPSPAPPAAIPARVGQLAIGQYVLSKFQPRLNFSIVDEGWSFRDETSSKATWLYQPEPGGKVIAGYINTVYSNLCTGGGDSLPLVNTSQELLDALQALRDALKTPDGDVVQLSDPEPIFVGDLKGIAIDVTIEPSVLAACGGTEIAVFPIDGSVFTIAPGKRFTVYALDVGGQNVSFVATSDATSDTPVPIVEAFHGVVRRLVDTVKF